ncbi:deoxynucleoside kinase [Clostridium sp. CAG:710]|nr:deoxynucleoside kinase [Clostridium sp. CAG:710]
MIITIDGLDGAGKSTLAKSLSEKLGYEYIDKPIYELFNVKGDDNYLYSEIYHIQDLIYNKTDSNTLKSYFTGLSLLYIKECMSDKNLIIDRGLLSAFAFNGDMNSKPVFETLINLGVFFDAAIIVTVSNEERIKRIKKRNENDPDLELDKIRNLRYDSMNQFILEHPELPCHIINTDNLTQEEVLDEALNYIYGITDVKKLVKTKSKND